MTRIGVTSYHQFRCGILGLCMAKFVLVANPSGDTFSLSFEADVDSINPTSFFIDDVSLEFCFQ